MFTRQVCFRGTQRCLRGKCALGAAGGVKRSRRALAGLARRKEARGTSEGARGNLRTVKIGQTGLTHKSPSPALKEAGQLGSYNLKRFERSYGGNCTAGTVQGQSGRSGARLALRLRAHLTGYAQKKKGVFETLTQGKGGVY